MRKIARFIIRFYQLAISPLTGPTCRFHPTCSAYALEAIDKHGALKGGFLALKRITKCHPFSNKAFSDPVPNAFAWGHLFRYKRGQDNNP